MAITGQPPVPSNLSATASSLSNIDVSWTNGITYTVVYILHKTVGSWSTLDTLDGDETSYEHEGVSTNVVHYYQVKGSHSGYTEPLSDPSNSDSAACWADTLTNELIVSESVTEYGTGSICSDTITDEIAVSESVSDSASATDVSDTLTDTMYVSDFAIDAKDIITNYVYYLGTAAGGIYEYGGFYKSDAGTAITARWESKDTDFADQSTENSDKFKTVEFVRLHYIDKSAGARISIKVSTDGGASWTTKTKSIGTGDSKGKTKDFHFIITGQIFRFAIESISVTDDFQWVGLEIFYNPGGDYF